MLEILVVDVSSANAMGAAPGRASLQDDLDWGWVAAQGVRGVIVENYVGNDGPNLDALQQLADVQAVGLVPGRYNFTFAGLPVDAAHPNRDARGQAELHFRAAAPLTGRRLRTWGDLEWPDPSAWTRWGITSAAQVDDWIAAYVERFEELSGEELGLYSYPSWAAEVTLPAGRPLWMAGSDQTAGAVLWQRTGQELMVPTRSGRPPVKTDCSLFVGDEDDWNAFVLS